MEVLRETLRPRVQFLPRFLFFGLRKNIYFFYVSRTFFFSLLFLLSTPTLLAVNNSRGSVEALTSSCSSPSSTRCIPARRTVRGSPGWGSKFRIGAYLEKAAGAETMLSIGQSRAQRLTAAKILGFLRTERSERNKNKTNKQPNVCHPSRYIRRASEFVCFRKLPGLCQLRRNFQIELIRTALLDTNERFQVTPGAVETPSIC